MGVGQSIENYAREFLDYDEKNNYGISCLYMPVRVLIDVRQSLKHTKKIHKQGGEAKEVLFKYEKLGVFCYYCGLLGHIEDHCERLFSASIDDGTRLWREGTRAELRNTDSSGSSRYLRGEGAHKWRYKWD